MNAPSDTDRSRAVTSRADDPSIDGAVAAVIWYAGGLLVVALGSISVAIVAGCAFPPFAWFVALAVPLALSMNRFVGFPNEVGVTAEAAALFAAMVVFRDDAAVLGPLLLALLVGPLDARHWERRSFVRMAYNSGSQALTVLVSIAVFVPLTAAWGGSWPAIAGAAAISAIPYVLLETGFGVGLFVLLGERALDATRQQLPINALAFPLALYGVGVGVLANDDGWWFAFGMLVPIAFVPEIVLLSRRRSGGNAARVLLLGGLAVLLASSVVLLPRADRVTAALLAVVTIALAVDCRVSARRPVPGLTGVAVVAAVVVAWPGPDRAVTTAALASVTIAGLVCVAVGERSFASAVWSAPIVGAGVVLAFVWRDIGDPGAAVFLGGIAAVLVAASAWGAPPWRSRFVGRWSYRHLDRRRRLLFLLAAVGALAAASVGMTVAADARPAWVLVAAALAQADVAMAMTGVRQWRFAPRGRRRDATLLLVAAGALVVAYPPIAAADQPVSWAVLVAALAAAAGVSAPLPAAPRGRADPDPARGAPAASSPSRG